MVLVLRQGTGLALSISTLPPGCSQKRSPALNTSSNTVDCYEVTEQGIRAVRICSIDYICDQTFWVYLFDARAYFKSRHREQKPRIAPRMGVASPSEVTHAHA